jgi:hypothetical protein
MTEAWARHEHNPLPRSGACGDWFSAKLKGILLAVKARNGRDIEAQYTMCKAQSSSGASRMQDDD